MKFIGLLVMLCASLLTVGCAGFTRIVDYEPGSPVVKIEKQAEMVPGSFDSFHKAQRLYEVRVAFFEWTEYEGLVQEIQFNDGTALVEYFLTPRGQFWMCRFDRHSTINDRNDIRSMLVYPADVEGADFRGPFAMLPQNSDGSVKTTTGPNFNADYLAEHEVRGRVTRCDKSKAASWKLSFVDGILKVEIPKQFQLK